MEVCSLIVGLGNPGERYAHTRHNAGFCVVDELAGKAGARWSLEKRFSVEVARATIGDRKSLLVKPQTFMNLSGEAVGALLHYYRIPIDGLMVVVDDADLPAGAVRMRASGSSGGHHGLESIAAHLGSTEFARQRIGIGRKDARQREITGHVLGRFTGDEWQLMQKVFVRASDQIRSWLQSGLEKAMNQYNGTVETVPSNEKDSL